MADDLKRLRDTLGFVEVDAMRGDTFAVMLCSAFDNPDEDDLDEYGWGPSAIAGYNATLDAIHAHYAAAFDRLRADRDAEIRRAVERERAYCIADVRQTIGIIGAGPRSSMASALEHAVITINRRARQETGGA
ncbi:hypothetical protein [Chelatococcus reniformis]|uniref:Uncharacterized protein n=1 Tax=Chelatococcus reniformis TaxID=1494448 RepID=A0A916UW40_9HYPH|nr:hypothetical protein [Chelatococcus reniformis]GGC90818.1 hypothetical protein GCM10010994_55760 [Chelatococcus reniformis]